MITRSRQTFGRLKSRLSEQSPAMTVAVIATVVALFGGTAFAASALTGKQKKEITKIATKIAKKFAGQDGAVGPQGPAGASGKDGSSGSNGAPGAAGKSVTGVPITSGGVCGTATGVKYTLDATFTNVCNGSNGAPGTNGKSPEVVAVDPPACGPAGGFTYEVEGSGEPEDVCNGEQGNPWSPENMLPPEATETGAWAFNGDAADTSGIYVPLSFTVKLPVALEESEVHFVESFTGTAPCPGSVGAPTAAPGHLCVYLGSSGLANTTFVGIEKPGSGPGEEIFGTNLSGAMLRFAAPSSGVAVGSGTFAVTAPAAP